MPRLSSFGKQVKRPDSLSPGDMKVPDRMVYKLVGGRPRTDVMRGGGPTVAPNDNAGRLDPQVGGKKRISFSQRYYQKSNPHQDYLHGNPDSRREVGEG